MYTLSTSITRTLALWLFSCALCLITMGFAHTRAYAAVSLAEDPTLTDGLVSYWPLDKEGGVRVDTIGDDDLHDVNGVSSGVVVVGNSHYMMQLDAFYHLGD